MPIVDNAIYAVGHRLARPAALGTTVQELRAATQGQDAFCWVGLLRPEVEEMNAVAREFSAAQRTYQLTREVIEFHRAVSPLRDMLADLRDDLKDRGSGSDLELRRALRDVADHVTRVHDRIQGFRELLTSLLDIDNALVARRQNEEMARMTQAGYEQNEQVKRISSWAAILFAPTLVASIYGMNFRHMPELGWPLGYPLAIALMVLLGLVLYLTFKRKGWL
jgi:magnesium transporter